MFWKKSIQQKLQEYQFPAGFETRLRIETGWNVFDSNFAIREYKKFMIYAAKTTSTPSKDVDIVWHLHLLYTREYEKFCKDIFGKFIHHDPSDGKKESKEKYQKQYQDTKKRTESTNLESSACSSSPSIWDSVTSFFSSDNSSDSFGGGSFGGGGADSGGSSCSSSCGSSCGGGD